MKYFVHKTVWRFLNHLLFPTDITHPGNDPSALDICYKIVVRMSG